jgi:hypothetical protein
LIDVCRCHAEALAESPVVNDERLFPLGLLTAGGKMTRRSL